MRTASDGDVRSGAVLVLVLAVLAVLVILAATLVLTARVESRTAGHYTAGEALAKVEDAVELWSADRVLLKGRFFGGAGGAFRFHDADRAFSLTRNSLNGASGEAAQLQRTSLLEPASVLEHELGGDGWIGGEELFGEDYAFHLREGEGGGSGRVEARFLLHLEDLGGARLDVNTTGNRIDGGGVARHVERHGLTPFETRLGDFFERKDVANPQETAAAVVASRGYGHERTHLEFPGGTPSYPDYPRRSEGNPGENQYPYDSGDLLDCVVAGLYSEFGTPPAHLEEYVARGFGPLIGEDIGADPGVADDLTTTSATNIFADFVEDAQDPDTMFEDSDRILQWLGADDLPLLRDGDPPFTGEGRDILLQRPLRRMMGEFRGDEEAGAAALKGLLDYIDDSGAGFQIPGGTGTDRIARNIWNMLAWIYEEDGIGNVSGGVVPGTPYVAEVMAHRPAYVIFPPNPDADRPDEDELDGMKYIKLVNPWPPAVESKAVEVLVNGESIKVFADGEIPARSHYLLLADSTPHHYLPPAYDVNDALESLSYGDTVQLRIAGTEEVLWETAAGGPHDLPDYWLLPASAQIADPRSRRPHNWDLRTPVPSLINPIWQGIPVPTPKGPVIWIWSWNWFLSGWYWPGGGTGDLAWYNRNWRASPIGRPAGGDGWHLLHTHNFDDLHRNVLGSFSVPYDGEDDERFFRSPADLTYVHAGLDWCTLSPFGDGDFAAAIGADDVVFLDALSRYLTGSSPYEHGAGGAPVYDDESGEYARLGPPVRLHGRGNVNSAPQEVLEAVIAKNVIEDWAAKTGAVLDEDQIHGIIAEMARAIRVERRTGGAFADHDDFFNRVPALFGDGITELAAMADWPSSPLRHAMARSLYNRITVRSDVWGVTGRMQLYEHEGGEADILAEKAFYTVIDRSILPPRVLLRTELPIR